MTNLVVKDLFRNTSEYADKVVTLEGWVKTVRDSKTFGFIELNDGSFFKNVQEVYTQEIGYEPSFYEVDVAGGTRELFGE